MAQESYSGRYFRTSWGDIKGSKGWFGKICLLGIISWIPIFGQMTLYGYAYEWAHKAAWGVDGPMPRKIYGRQGSKMLRWGWFALVIMFVLSLVPGIISSIGSWLSAAGSINGFTSSYGHQMIVNEGNPLLSGLGWIFGVAAVVIWVFACLFIFAGTMRMTMYDRLSTGFQLGKVWDMIARDFGGIMRIFGMSLLFGVIGGAIISIVMAVVVMGSIMAVIVPTGLMSSGGVMYYSEAAAFYALGAIIAMIPVLLVIGYVATVYSAFVELLTARALGYWMRQFNVAAWGTKDDPLPAPSTPPAGAQPVPPVTSAPSASSVPVSPVDAPAVAGDAPVVADEVVETVVTDAQGDVVAAEVDEVEVTVESEDASEEK